MWENATFLVLGFVKVQLNYMPQSEKKSKENLINLSSLGHNE